MKTYWKPFLFGVLFTQILAYFLIYEPIWGEKKTPPVSEPAFSQYEPFVFYENGLVFTYYQEQENDRAYRP